MNKDRILQLARNLRGRARNCIKLARNRVEKGLQHAYVGRKLKKRYWRSVWIQRINAATKEHGVSLLRSAGPRVITLPRIPIRTMHACTYAVRIVNARTMQFSNTVHVL